MHLCLSTYLLFILERVQALKFIAISFCKMIPNFENVEQANLLASSSRIKYAHYHKHQPPPRTQTKKTKKKHTNCHTTLTVNNDYTHAEEAISNK